MEDNLMSPNEERADGHVQPAIIRAVFYAEGLHSPIMA
jgi:hypothetical protein